MPRTIMNNSTKTNDTSISHKYLQTVYVVDQYLSAYLGQSTLKILLPTVANIVRISFYLQINNSMKLCNK